MFQISCVAVKQSKKPYFQSKNKIWYISYHLPQYLVDHRAKTTEKSCDAERTTCQTVFSIKWICKEFKALRPLQHLGHCRIKNRHDYIVEMSALTQHSKKILQWIIPRFNHNFKTLPWRCKLLYIKKQQARDTNTCSFNSDVHVMMWKTVLFLRNKSWNPFMTHLDVKQRDCPALYEHIIKKVRICENYNGVLVNTLWVLMLNDICFHLNSLFLRKCNAK